MRQGAGKEKVLIYENPKKQWYEYEYENKINPMTETDENREPMNNNCVHASESFRDYATRLLNELLEFKSVAT